MHIINTYEYNIPFINSIILKNFEMIFENIINLCDWYHIQIIFILITFLNNFY